MNGGRPALLAGAYLGSLTRLAADWLTLHNTPASALTSLHNCEPACCTPRLALSMAACAAVLRGCSQFGPFRCRHNFAALCAVEELCIPSRPPSAAQVATVLRSLAKMPRLAGEPGLRAWARAATEERRCSWAAASAPPFRPSPHCSCVLRCRRIH